MSIVQGRVQGRDSSETGENTRKIEIDSESRLRPTVCGIGVVRRGRVVVRHYPPDRLHQMEFSKDNLLLPLFLLDRYIHILSG